MKMFNKLKTIISIHQNLKKHIAVLSVQIGERNSYQYSALNKAFHYIRNGMTQSSFQVDVQTYIYKEHKYYNIIAEKKGSKLPNEIILIGAHYDTVYGSPGADDNASGIAAILELVRLMDDFDSSRTIRFIAFSLEEPPFFNTEYMGSYVYAKSCKDKEEKIVAMFTFEMLAYFKNKKGSQQYHTQQIKADFPDKGNFIAIVGNVESKNIVKKLSYFLNETSLIRAEPVITYEQVKGADFSDHASFWKFGFNAAMITDTAFYRNPYYHDAEDTIDKLNFKKFAKLVFGLCYAFKKFDSEIIESV